MPSSLSLKKRKESFFVNESDHKIVMSKIIENKDESFYGKLSRLLEKQNI